MSAPEATTRLARVAPLDLAFGLSEGNPTGGPFELAFGSSGIWIKADWEAQRFF